MKIKAVIFDFDGLIVDTESIWYAVFREVFQKYQYDLTLDEFSLCIGTHNSVLFNHLRKKIQFTDEAVMKEVDALYEDHLQTLTLRDGVLDYLLEAKRLGLKIGLASSSKRDWVEGLLERFGIKEYFDVIKTANDVTNIKPDPELYIAAIKDLQVEPYEAVAFEDSRNGLDAALAAGLNAVIVPNKVTSLLAFEGHKLRLNSMADMPLEELLLAITIADQIEVE